MPASDARTPTVRLRAWIDREPVVAIGALLLVVADLALVLVHVVAVTRAVESPFLRLDMDRSYAELFEYIKMIWSLVVLGLVAFAARSFAPIAWAPFLALLLLDNGWTLHERVGSIAAERLGLSHDGGELAFVAVAYSLAALPVLVAAIRVPDSRALHRRLAIAVAALLAFGVGGDLLHAVAIAFGGEPMQRTAAIVEDGGELVAFSLVLLACATSLVAARRRSQQVTQASGAQTVDA